MTWRKAMAGTWLTGLLLGVVCMIGLVPVLSLLGLALGASGLTVLTVEAVLVFLPRTARPPLRDPLAEIDMPTTKKACEVQTVC